MFSDSGAKMTSGASPRQLSSEELALFAQAARFREVAPGEVLFRRGELGRSMFIVESGQVRLEFGDGLPDKLIGPREFFGELVLFVGSHTRVANAVALTPTGLRIVEHDAFERMLEAEPRVVARFMRRSFAYLVASEQQLIQGLRRRNEDLMVTLDSLRQTRTRLTTAERLVQTDELTGLCNRRGLYTYLERLHEQRLPDTVLGLLLVDLDRFKQINDRCGHVVGDQVLRAIAEEVQGAASSIDVPCRLGGDEFALLMQVTGEEELRARATQIIAGVNALRFPGFGSGLEVTVSIGGSVCEDGVDWAVWYSDADSALYRTKGRGGDGYEVGNGRGAAP
ncbi:GGDEF domain-containing protein [Dokdonella sp.]|uniref:GGDEF domain-containing protein n=1 Tax=Dokdonella sp. TaxID=2291710 RepID=UPI002602C1E3|nr:GGDEF domain-containing protein [Dokdonella sp.]